MRQWVDRPIEIRNLFNPAFCGLVLFRALAGFHSRDAKGMPFSLSLLVLPLCLQQSSREILQRGNRSYFLKVVADHPELLVGFCKRCTDVLPFTFEALGLLMHLDTLVVSPDGRLLPGRAGVRKTISGSDESKACQRVAAFLGKEFAQIADRGTIYTTLGIRP
ncbi:three component ABC system middle component [Mesorhizobium sp. BAC0120]|uniref:three component ABC system middle component n=1 Tax=Mesorhizobium sp. BAC0120 TaxID=3090670 RepID=UPI00298D0CE4|nr:three component ABC system middle component [Mesorhizobium sp. BAC0120]MDW6024871.1 three component ABC system middle component [Mesorhizobium sp. BAC0120]